MWTFAGVEAIGALLRGSSDEGFLGIWLIFWLLADIFVAVSWVWNVFGYEQVEAGAGELTIAWYVGRLPVWRRVHPLAACTNLRASGSFGSPFGWGYSMRAWGFGGGTIAFDCCGGTVRFGSSLKEDEATAVADDLRGHLHGA